MRLLCIANPQVYGRTRTDVPLSYANLAAHPQVQLFHADSETMMQPGRHIRAVPVNAGFRPEQFSSLGRGSTLALSPEDIDVVFCRTLKPFPTGYLESLGRWSNVLSFVNDPRGVRKQLDQGFLLESAAKYLPHSIITARAAEAEGFLRRHGTIVAKKSNSCGGRGVFRVSSTAAGRVTTDNVIDGARTYDAFNLFFDHLTSGGEAPILLARYLPRVTEGDKRVVVVNGEVYGAYVRRSTDGNWVQNVSLGGGCELATTSSQEQAIIEATQVHYSEAGLRVLGYDFLQDDDGRPIVSEINAGNVGGLARLEQLGKTGTTSRFVSWLHQLIEPDHRGAPIATSFPFRSPAPHKNSRSWAY